MFEWYALWGICSIIVAAFITAVLIKRDEVDHIKEFLAILIVVGMLFIHLTIQEHDKSVRRNVVVELCIKEVKSQQEWHSLSVSTLRVVAAEAISSQKVIDFSWDYDDTRRQKIEDRCYSQLLGDADKT